MQEKAPKGFFHYLSRMYFDIALSASPYALPSLRVAADTSHILYGSDYPFAPSPGIKMNTEGFATSSLFIAEEKKAIDENNALALFPGLKLRIEAGS
jgi:predicted TIM-barrel fold metal-dependent hydrolase